MFPTVVGFLHDISRRPLIFPICVQYDGLCAWVLDGMRQLGNSPTVGVILPVAGFI
jgi:hypothetical protein